MSESLEPAYFDAVYAASDDPWSFATSVYEREKYDRSLATLTRERYGDVLEIGCSIGVFTERLAARAERLLAVDVSERALERARARCAGLANVTFRRAVLPAEFPPGRFDLVVLSEVGYYFSDADLAEVRARIANALTDDGELLLVHFLPKVEDYVRDGDAVHAAFTDDPALRVLRSHRAERYRIDLLTRATT